MLGGNPRQVVERPRPSVSRAQAAIQRLYDGVAAEVAFFTLNGTWLALYGRKALAEDAAVSAEGRGFEGFTLAHNVESEAEADAVVNQAVKAEAALVKRPQKVFWGGYSGYFKDPDGHLWEVAYNPHFWVGPRDDSQ